MHGGLGTQCDQTHRPHRLALALELERLEVLDLAPVPYASVGLAADQDLAGLRGLLEPGGDVDGVPRAELLPRSGVAGDDLAGVDARTNGDADAEVPLEV